MGINNSLIRSIHTIVVNRADTLVCPFISDFSFYFSPISDAKCALCKGIPPQYYPIFGKRTSAIGPQITPYDFPVIQLRLRSYTIEFNTASENVALSIVNTCVGSLSLSTVVGNPVELLPDRSLSSLFQI